MMASMLRIAGCSLVLLVLCGTTPAGTLASRLSEAGSEHWTRAQRAFLVRNYGTAERELREIAVTDPDYPGIYSMYMYILSFRPEALRNMAERYRSLAAEHPERAIYWYAYARFEQNPALSEAAFQRVVELEPDAPWGYVGLAYLARVTCRVDEAIALYEKALAMDPENPAIMSGLVAACGFSRERQADAVRMLDALRAADPDGFSTERATISIMLEVRTEAGMAAARQYLAKNPRGEYADYARSLLANGVWPQSACDPECLVR